MTGSNKNWLIKTGDFFFKWRNYLFPVFILCLVLPFPVPNTYFGKEWLEENKDMLAIITVLAGLGFRVLTIGWAYIKRGGLNKQVYADTLVREGLFGVCRNPLYVGNMLIYCGIFILHGNPIVMLIGIPAYTFIYIAIIAAEEHFLRNKFGAEFDAYCGEVPRWMPVWKNYKKSIEGMNFSFRRAIFKDYTTIFNSVLAMSVVETLEEIHAGKMDLDFVNIVLMVLMTVSLIGFVTVAYLKKTKNVKI